MKKSDNHLVKLIIFNLVMSAQHFVFEFHTHTHTLSKKYNVKKNLNTHFYNNIKKKK